jgi:di/tricarboxylate transporter
VDFHQILVLTTVIFLVFALYRELFNPALTFFICVGVLIFGGVLTPADLLKGLSNTQIIIIFLLILVTAGVRAIYGNGFFLKLFNLKLSPKAFLLRMMMSSSLISGFLNNTPIVAFLIPYVKDWADKTGNSPSKFLIPLSYATILGGMITVVGTSTNLVLNGLISEYNLPLLQFTDFLYLGLIVTLLGWIYLYFFGYRLLPSRTGKLEELKHSLKEYIVETEIFKGSVLSGKTVKEAGLRNLKDLFLVEVLRENKIVSPVAPDFVLAENDLLFFSGNTNSIFDLIKEENGIRLPKQDKLKGEGHFNFIEAVIPANSGLIGVKIKESDFRNRFNASIVAVHRAGKRVAGKVGETTLAGGDFLLLVSGGEYLIENTEKDLFFISTPKSIVNKKPTWMYFLGATGFIALIGGITGMVPLFNVLLGILAVFVMVGILNIVEIKRQLDLSLLMVLVCSLSIGVALQKTGLAEIIAAQMLWITSDYGAIASISLLFITTTALTALITNPAAVAMMFPIALAMADASGLTATPFFIAIAFAASGDFITPIGYQTNLMVFGPGGYTFKDFARVGAPLTVLYIIVCISFISYYYNLY